jgi:hypothetical protein
LVGVGNLVVTTLWCCVFSCWFRSTRFPWRVVGWEPHSGRKQSFVYICVV